MNNYEPKLIHIEGLTVAGVSVRTINRDEFDPKTAKLGIFWQNFRTENIPARVSSAVPYSPVYGVYSNYDSNESGYYTLTAGIEIHSSSESELGFTKIEIPAGQYLVFSDKGAMPEVIVKVWQRIWNYFSNENPYKRCFDVDFELYSNAEGVAIYIGVT